LPYEVYDLTVKVTWLRIVAVLINLLLVIYLVWSKRLLGARGGKKAYEAQLRGESLIEVEQAALATSPAASAAPVGPAVPAGSNVPAGSAGSVSQPGQGGPARP
jgi:hypothetical protein